MSSEHLKGPFASSYVVPYERDRELFERLGLKAQKDLPHQQWITVGEVVDPVGEKWRVKIEVQKWPAAFWRFAITNVEGHELVVGTGSGALVDFWPSAVLVAKGMLVPVWKTDTLERLEGAKKGLANVIGAWDAMDAILTETQQEVVDLHAKFQKTIDEAREYL